MVVGSWEQIQKGSGQTLLRQRHRQAALAVGGGMDLRMQMEETILSNLGAVRLPGGPPSHYVGLNTVLGRDDELDFADYLGDVRKEEVEVHIPTACEERFFGSV